MTLTLKVISLNQEEEKELIKIIGNDKFVGNLTDEMNSYPNLKDLEITEPDSPDGDIGNWKPIAGNTNLNFI